MRRLIAATVFVAGLTMLAACGDKSSPNTPTEEENRQLDNAAEMLDASPDSMVANEDAPLGNGEVDVVESDDSAVANERSTNSVGNAQ